MAAVRSSDTQPERLLRQELWRRGLRYRLRHPLPGRPDLVFVGRRVTVFVDGDFWHGHGWRERGFETFEAQFANHRNPDKWRRKITRNMERDREVEDQLTLLGWQVLRIRESTVRKDVVAAADEVERVLRAHRRGERTVDT